MHEVTVECNFNHLVLRSMRYVKMTDLSTEVVQIKRLMDKDVPLQETQDGSDDVHLAFYCIEDDR